MTQEEAILLSAYTGFLLAPDFSEVHKFCEDTLGRPIWTHEFADICVQKEIQEKLRPQIMELIQNISAFRPVSREQVEKVWRGCPECKPRCGLCVHMGAWDRHRKNYVCEQCVDYSNFESDQKFCEVCGRPMTDEAVEIVMERMEALYGKSKT